MYVAKLIAPRCFRGLAKRSSIAIINLDVLVWQYCSPSGMAAKTHLLLDSKAQILDEMKAIRPLSRLRRALTCSLRVEPASVSAHDLNRGMPLQPSRNARHAPVFENVHDLSTFEIDNDRAVAPRFPPTPVIDTDDPSRGFVVGSRSISLQVPKDSLVADRHPEPLHQPFPGAPAHTVAKQADYLGDPTCAAGIGRRNRWDLVSEGLPSALPICATPAAQL
jgi:hypothetical protein